jgi:hypothetical protein
VALGGCPEERHDAQRQVPAQRIPAAVSLEPADAGRVAPPASPGPDAAPGAPAAPQGPRP